MIPVSLLAMLLLPAVLITSARLLDPRDGMFQRLVSFTPFALVPYGVALLVLVPLMIRGGGVSRTLARVVGAGALVGLLVHTAWLTPALVGSPAEGAVTAEGQRLRVMTVNLQYGRADADEVALLALRNRADVLALQEVDADAMRALRATALDEELPHRAGRPAPGPAGTVVLSRVPVTDVQPLATGFGSYAMRLEGGLGLVAVHTRAPLGDAAGWWADHRAVAAAAAGADTGSGALVVGDLNATTDHQPLRELKGRGFRDAATRAGALWQPTWPAYDAPSIAGIEVPPMLAIDHVLVSEGIEVVETWTDEVPGSDHASLFAVLALPAADVG